MNFETLIQNLQVTHHTFFTSAAKAINTAMTLRNWLCGYYIVEFEQNGEDRAKYGTRLLKELSDRIQIKGISETNLKIFRQFYIIYPSIRQAVPDILKQIPIIQAVPEQYKGSGESLIRQAVPDELKTQDIKEILPFNEIVEGEHKPGLDPERLLQTLSFTHIVELIKIEELEKYIISELTEQ